MKKQKRLKVSNDLIFKLLFGSEESKNMLSSLLSAIIDMPREEMSDLVILNPISSIDKIGDKVVNLDILVKTKNNMKINVEIQVVVNSNWPRRIAEKSRKHCSRTKQNKAWARRINAVKSRVWTRENKTK